MNNTKIVFIGAGSVCFGTSTFRDIFTCPELKNSTLSLVDVNPVNLDRMYNLALVMNKAAGFNMTIEMTTDRTVALPGAEFVINSIAVERCELWKHDWLVPKKYGIRHTLGENGGPGGLFFTMRTIPYILDIARDMERLCPGAWFINFSNPESRIILALSKYTTVKCVGLCHGIYGAVERIARITGLPEDKVEVLGAGLNHFQWMLQARHKDTLEDLYPLLREKNAAYDPAYEPLSRRLFTTFGLFPSCGDGHIGEYLPYGWEAGEEGYTFDEDERHKNHIAAEADKRISGEIPVEGWWLTPSIEHGIDVVTAIMNNKKTVLQAGIVMNNGAISNLPGEAAVEVPAVVDRSGVTPMRVGALPANIARLLSAQVFVQQAAVEAAVYGDKGLALQTLLIDPVVNSSDAAVKVLDELWEINKPHIRRCV